MALLATTAGVSSSYASAKTVPQAGALVFDVHAAVDCASELDAALLDPRLRLQRLQRL